MIRYHKSHTIITGLLAGILLFSLNLPLRASGQVQYVGPGQYLHIDNKFDTGHRFSISEAPYIASVHNGYVEGIYPGLTAITYEDTGKIAREYIGVKGLLPSNPYLRVGLNIFRKVLHFVFISVQWRQEERRKSRTEKQRIINKGK